MNPITCGMAADLLPLYLDGCCSADSRAALEAHMDACPVFQCKKIRKIGNSWITDDCNIDQAFLPAVKSAA